MHKFLITFCLIALSSCATFNSVDKERFELNGDSTVLDKHTKLMWAAMDNRQSVTWMEAEKYCASFKKGGYDDWRMPKKSELAALIKANISQQGKTIHISSPLIWAAETQDSKGTYCDFKAGRCSWMEKVVSISLHALPVRDTTTTTIPSEPSQMESFKVQSPKQRLQIIDSLHRQKLITTEEYNQKKAAILNEL